MFGRKREQDPAVRSEAALRCSFCQKTADRVRKLIAGPAVFICDECVGVCNQIIADDERMSSPVEGGSRGLGEGWSRDRVAARLWHSG
jgi:hypothetical protein